MVAKIRARRSSGGSSGGSFGGGSSGGYVSGGSSGGVSYATYSAPVQTISYGASAPTQTISYGASAGSYESPVIQSSYDTYSPVGEIIIDGGYDQGSGIIESGSSVLESGTIIDSAPVEMGHQSVSHESRKPAIDSDSALLTVAVPNDSAKVIVNGHATKSSGSVRQFMSRGLKDGFVYTYVVKVEYDFDGKTKSDSKEVKLRPGQTEQVVFETAKEVTQPSETDTAVVDAQPVTTIVKLNVPSGAKVNLAGTDTNGKGMIRTFRTRTLKVGQSWEDYTVRVTANVGGQEVSKEQTVNVMAGSTTELTFDFDVAEVAQN